MFRMDRISLMIRNVSVTVIVASIVFSGIMLLIGVMVDVTNATVAGDRFHRETDAASFVGVGIALTDAPAATEGIKADSKTSDLPATTEPARVSKARRSAEHGMSSQEDVESAPESAEAAPPPATEAGPRVAEIAEGSPAETATTAIGEPAPAKTPAKTVEIAARTNAPDRGPTGNPERAPDLRSGWQFDGASFQADFSALDRGYTEGAFLKLRQPVGPQGHVYGGLGYQRADVDGTDQYYFLEPAKDDLNRVRVGLGGEYEVNPSLLMQADVSVTLYEGPETATPRFEPSESVFRIGFAYKF